MNDKNETIVVHISFEVWKEMCSKNSNLMKMQEVNLAEIERLRAEVKSLTYEVEWLQKAPSYDQLAMDNLELIRIGMSMADEIDAVMPVRPECVVDWYNFNGAEADPKK